jgi:hypothetical protein
VLTFGTLRFLLITLGMRGLMLVLRIGKLGLRGVQPLPLFLSVWQSATPLLHARRRSCALLHSGRPGATRWIECCRARYAV